jgi:hypothetical protein
MVFRVLRVAPVIVFLHAVVPKLEAGLILVSQDRRVSVSEDNAGYPVGEDEAQATGFGLFDKLVDLSGSAGLASADASQTSFLSSSRVTAVGSAMAMGNYDWESGITYGAAAASSFRLSFDITRTETWDIHLTTERGGLGQAFLNFLKGPQGYVLYYTDFEAQTLVLTPGRYDLWVSASAGGSSPPDDAGGARYDLTFQHVPEPGSAVLLTTAVVVLGVKFRQSRR